MQIMIIINKKGIFVFDREFEFVLNNGQHLACICWTLQNNLQSDVKMKEIGRSFEC